MTYTEIVEKLVGKISPVGEASENNIRFENLKQMCKLVNNLVTEINYVAYYYKDRQEHSMKIMGEYAKNFLTIELGISE